MGMADETTENSKPATKHIGKNGRPCGTANLIPWKPGQSGNPGGRPKGVPARIAALAKHPDELFEFLYQIVRGEHPDQEKFTGRDRMTAATELLNRQFGRPVETQVQLQADAHEASKHLSLGATQLEALARALIPSATVTRSSENPDTGVVEAEVVRVEPAED